ncbi:class I SAM-dependent methyltransferase [Actinoplanes sp. NPDC023714]|uniref:class I SAM-dependent methyltransferase n=1 Tax=Actinoplanes sp. NPDC023714 TaxID=3154322 RepID=UPI0033F0E2E4
MDWVSDFYSRTGRWWGPAEARIGERDHDRVALLHRHAGADPMTVLELGSGYGTTAAATAMAGHTVTAVEISERVGHAARLAAGLPTGSLTTIKSDFFTVRIEARFRAITYWNGFGVGSDADQRRLLARVATWLEPGGIALIDVFNPIVWASWHGRGEHKLPHGDYRYELRRLTTFDPVASTATDTWWQVDRPDERISQLLRCYGPAELALLLEGTGLRLTGIDDRGRDMLTEADEYTALLTHEPAGVASL